MVRHRMKFIDGSIVLLVTLLAAFYAYEVDIFSQPGVTPAERTIELDEVMIIAAVFCGGMTIFSVRRLMDAQRETRRRISAEREARTLAFHDPLTGLPNRRQFLEALQVAIASPPRSGASHALLLLDLNGFKRVNDVFGHPAGDEMLTQIAGRLARTAREGDLVARLGGDEFAILALHLTGADAATGLAIRVIEAIEAPATVSGTSQRVGTAIGITLIPQDGSDADQFIRNADIALYRAKEDKHRGRSALRYFEPAMDELVRERSHLEQELQLAIESRSIKPFYQPLVAFDGSGITGFEALARWTSPRRGDIPPERFIAVAEDCGLIGALTDQILKQACADAATWPRPLTLAFNVSGLLLHDPTFGLKVLGALAESGLSPARLEIEITESTLVRDLDAARNVLDKLRAAGVRVALDDFGTGYSNLYHLQALKPDKIKIDRSFVNLMNQDASSAAIVKALIGFGSGFGAQVTAEGVETAEQEALLRAHGCDFGQGFHFSKAVDADQALALATGALVQNEPRKA